MLKRLFFPGLVALILLYGCSRSDSLQGYWTGTMKMNGKTTDLALTVDSAGGYIASRDLMMWDQPVDELKAGNGTVSFTADMETELRFTGEVDGKTIRGKVSIPDAPPGLTIDFVLERQSGSPPERNYVIEPVTVRCNGIKLSTEIYRPLAGGRHPALVLMHGSTTNLKTQYAWYADLFASKGFEVLIFDKRGSGASTGNAAAASYDDLAGDAIACLGVMVTRKSVDRSRIGLWGFSQGAMLIPYIMEKTRIPSFVIAVSPEVHNPAEAAAFADSIRVVSGGNPPEAGHIAAESHRLVARMIAQKRDLADVSRFIRENAEKYPFMAQTGLPGNLNITPEAFDSYYWKGRSMDLLPNWKDMRVKSLVIFGEKDELVDARRNASLITALGNPGITVLTLAGANHAMKKRIEPANPADTDWPRVVNGYPEALVKWLDEQTR